MAYAIKAYEEKTSPLPFLTWTPLPYGFCFWYNGSCFCSS
jgi:hypothetical protein